MSYRKFAADQLFTGYRMLGAEAVLITDEAGVVHNITNVSEAGKGIERFNGILSPGFINCHCHLELSHMKGMVPRHSGMVNFLLTVMGNRNSELNIIGEAIEQAEIYMQEKGIVAVGDICNTPHTIPLKAKHHLYYHNFIEATGFVESTAESRYRQAYELYLKLYPDSPEDIALTNASIVPHAPYSVSDRLFQLINEQQQGSLLTMHNQESEAETEFFSTGRGDFLELFRTIGVELKSFTALAQSSLVSSLEKITNGHSLILVHNVNTTRQDLEWIWSAKGLPDLFWCLCPNANLYINDRLPDVAMLQDFNCKIVMGTDSLASNSQLNILEEIKTLQQYFPAIATEDLLKWSTMNGAEALRIENRYGSFEKGKTPGIVNIDGGKNGLLAGSVAKKIL